ncbi:hypothetical protein EOI86_09450 [Hwanghaeella grinnelliae]|uniref:DUF4136 domain-containing protein n=1 Tax=Hwanghaeella grinnelliae TaxID=2500179 RepID=A0A437QY33_9PROT|nr:hypothetical protein [Hwanghaeella grinnelliae]RVU39441.1 hypothetical protein EOI86_09450 [Hwanghaeella grinnelliae]
MAIDFTRFFRFLTALLTLSFLLTPATGASAADSDEVARIVTRVAAQLPDNAVIWAQPSQNSDLNDRLAEEFRLVIDHIGRAPTGDGTAPVYSLVFDADVMGTIDQSDTSIGKIEGNAEGKLDFQLKLWSSGGGSSLFQGQGTSGEVNLRGFRMNAALHLDDKVIWQGFAATNSNSGDPFDALAPLVQVLMDRLDIDSDEVIPLH